MAFSYNQLNAQCGCTNCPLALPDGANEDFFVNVNDDLGQAGNACLTSVLESVNINFDHTYLGDLRINITSPDGNTATLVGPVGLSGGSGTYNLTFEDGAANGPWVSAGQGSTTGTYEPNSGTLASLVTSTVCGTWTINVLDDQGIDSGNFIDFALEFSDGGASSTPTFVCNSDDPPVCPVAGYAYTTPTSVCAGETVNFTEGGACTDDGPTNGLGTTADTDFDLYFYFDGTSFEAPVGFDPLPNTIIGGFIPSGTNNLYRPTAGTTTIAGCGDLSTSVLNPTCAPITVSFFILPYNYDYDSDNDAVFGEYTAGLCAAERHDVIIYPSQLSVVTTDDGSTCGTPGVELRSADGTVCETETGAACSSNTDMFNYDFSSSPTATALSGASGTCALPTLTGTINCSNCCNAVTPVWD